MPTLVEAIYNKYDSTEETKVERVGYVILAPKTRPQDSIPHLLVITSSDVDKAGDLETLGKYTSNVEEMDISRNRLDMSEIALILSHSPRLKFLNIGFNDFSSAIIPSSMDFPVSHNLVTLILVGTNAAWSLVWLFLKHATNLKELHLSLNGYSAVELKKSDDFLHDETFPTITKVMFDENPISSWEEIKKLGFAFPNLQHLSLTSCPISGIPSDAYQKFSCLSTLWLSKCLISKQQDVENLNSFPLLTDLRLNGVPYLQDLAEETRRQHIISILPNIETLNRGCSINADERETAERNFIRYYLDHPDPPARYHELSAKHGEVHKLVDINLKPTDTVNLLVRCDDKEVARVAVNLKQSVKDLKNYLEPIVGVKATKMELYYLDVGLEGRDIMKFPTKQLYTYQMRDNDEIHIIVKK